MRPLFDTHCDTPRYILDRAEKLKNSSGHVSLEKSSDFSPYIQVAAIWSTFDDTNVALRTFREAHDRFSDQCNLNGCGIITDVKGLTDSVNMQLNGSSPAGFIYCIEDCGFITDLDILKEAYDRGVRVLIPMWGKTNALGASHEAEGGLTDLGNEILTEAAKMGFILDISHSSAQSATEIMDIAEYHSSPVIASHSNSYSFYQHTRNLTDKQIERLVSLNGIIGHSLCPWHLAENGNADINSVLSNIEALINTAGEDNVCFGCDLDGTNLPAGFTDIASLEVLYTEISRKFSPQLADKIYFNNAYQRFLHYLK